jgi:hypothetical protein
MTHLLDGANFSFHYCNWSWIRWVSALGNKHRSKLVGYDGSDMVAAVEVGVGWLGWWLGAFGEPNNDNDPEGGAGYLTS